MAKQAEMFEVAVPGYEKPAALLPESHACVT